MAQAETAGIAPESAKCDHDWRPLGVAYKDLGSAGYCVRCRRLRWLKASDWEANRARHIERAMELGAMSRAGESDD